MRREKKVMLAEKTSHRKRTRLEKDEREKREEVANNRLFYKLIAY